MRRVDERITDACAGQGSVLMSRRCRDREDDPGHGSRLGRKGIQVVSVRGIEGESHLAFAALADLLGSLAGNTAGLPDPQRTALEGVRSGRAPAIGWPCARRADTPHRRRAAGAGLAPGRRRAVDRSLVDRGDRFALHRIESDPIVELFVVVRSHEPGNLDPAAFPVMDLGGLEGDAANELLRRSGADPADGSGGVCQAGRPEIRWR